MTTPPLGPVLVVEDDPDILSAVTEVLEAEGYSVATATNGREGLVTLAAIRRPCLILLDMKMPEMDGNQFFARLAVDPVNRTVPVVLMTAGNDPVLSGLAACLKKPFELSEMINVVAAHCLRA